MKHILYLFLFVFLFSCGNNKKNTLKITKEKPKLSIAKQHTTLEKVNAIFSNEIENWQELKTVKDFLKKFEKISPNEALSNALELRDLVSSLRDSIKPKKLNIPAFNARINILNWFLID